MGFTIFWQKTKRGSWRMACKTRRARRTRAIKSAYDWCRRHRHWPIKAQHAALSRKLRGHFNYFGVNGNSRALASVLYWVVIGWWKWLWRRSQRARMPWPRFAKLLERYPLPAARVRVRIWE